MCLSVFYVSVCMRVFDLSTRGHCASHYYSFSKHKGHQLVFGLGFMYAEISLLPVRTQQEVEDPQSSPLISVAPPPAATSMQGPSRPSTWSSGSPGSLYGLLLYQALGLGGTA